MFFFPKRWDERRTRQIPGFIDKVLSKSCGRWDSIISHCWRPLCILRPYCQRRCTITLVPTLGVTGAYGFSVSLCTLGDFGIIGVFFLFFWIQLCLYISHSSVCVSVLLCVFAIICPPLLCLNHNLLHGGFSRLCFLHRATSQLPAGITARRVCHSGGNNLDKSMDFSFFIFFFWNANQTLNREQFGSARAVSAVRCEAKVKPFRYPLSPREKQDKNMTRKNASKNV